MYILKIMSKSTIAILIYILRLVFGALVLGLWNTKTGPKSIIGIVWTALFLIALFYSEKKNIM